MPVAQKVLEETQYLGLDNAPPVAPKLELGLFEEIKESLVKIKQCKSEQSENERKLEKMTKTIEAADEMIEKAQLKRDLLIKKREDLKSTLENMLQRKKEALEYWNKFYGLDVRQLSNENDNYELYEFIFSNLPNKDKQPSTVEEQGVVSENNVTNSANDGKCSINLKFTSCEKKLEIVSQYPDTIPKETLIELNSQLTNDCIHPETGFADYKSAMRLIKKQLLKSLTP